MLLISAYLVLFCLAVLPSPAFPSPSASESLQLLSLPSTSLSLVRLSFDLPPQTLPKRLRQLLSLPNVHFLRVEGARGRWFYDRFGNVVVSPNSLPSVPSPPGFTLRVDFSSSLNSSSIDSDWERVVTTLSGLLFISSSQLSRFSTSYSSGFSHFLPSSSTLIGRMSRESLCTENLVAVRRLLPALGMRGLATLLEPQLILTGNHYHSVHLSGSLEKGVKISISVVVDEDEVEEWKKLTVVGLPKSLGQSRISETVLESEEEVILDQMVHFEKPKWIHPLIARKTLQSDSLYGFGGSVVYSFRLSDEFEGNEVSFILSDVIPWFLRFEFHSLETSVHFASDSAIHVEPAPQGVVIQSTMITLKKNEVAYIKAHFSKNFLPLDSHPPDPNRGFDWPGAVIMVMTQDDQWIEYHTDTVLVAMPQPDFSMPFNVMMMSATAVSLFFGALLSSLAHRKEWKARRRVVKAIEKWVTKQPDVLFDEEFSFEKEEYDEGLLEVTREYFGGAGDSDLKEIARDDFEVRFAGSWKLFFTFINRMTLKAVRFVARWKKSELEPEAEDAISHVDIHLLTGVRRSLVHLFSPRWKDDKNKEKKSKKKKKKSPSVASRIFGKELTSDGTHSLGLKPSTQRNLVNW